ncbi:hypothetical protein F4781DRAFT_432778 [Annulohypoxylon bovei var. microspora]|nr:hypothetical protein F4781DRAFT_432778 [Annulohypoxylon bovei var. microspora]
MSYNPLICYSLRKRPDWASFASAALQGSSMRWKEAKLDTHDAALPIPRPGGQSQRVLRAIFLSPSDVGTDDCQTRIQRLSHLNGGQDIVIVFLLKQENDKVNPMSAFMTLQLDLGEFEMPIIPVNSVQAVSNSLMAFHHQISTSNGSRRIASPVQALLPYCSDRRSLSEHAVNVLTDITSDIRDLLNAMSAPARQTKIIELMESDDAEGAISFWAEEYLVE